MKKIKSEPRAVAEASDDVADMVPAFISAKPSMSMRFDTPLMGIMAAVFVSYIGFIGASALLT